MWVEDPSESLIKAVHAGDVENAKSLINTYGLSYSRAWAYGYDLLCDALENKDPTMGKLLLMSGAAVNSRCRSWYLTPPLHYAADRGYTEIVSMLIERKADVNATNDFEETALLYAVNENRLEIVQLLIQENASIEEISMAGITPLHSAVSKGYLLVAKEILNHSIRSEIGLDKSIGQNYTQLHLASLYDDESLVERLIREGADINAETSDGKTPLHVATAFMDEKLVKLLLKKGASVGAKDGDGNNALHIAASCGSAEIVKVLLANKANCNSLGKNHATPLHSAVREKRLTVVKMLLDNGVDVDAQLDDGNTALHIASRDRQVDIIKLLAEGNANLDMRNKRGMSPLHLAFHKDRCDVLETLLTFEARSNTKNTQGETVLHRTGIDGYPIVFELLLNYGADVNATCEDSMTPLEYVHFWHTQVTRHGDWKIHGDLEFSYHMLRRYMISAQVLIRTIIAIMALDRYVSEENVAAVDEYHDTLEKFRTEVERMKRTKIGDTTVTFYHVLTGNVNQLVNYARNESIVEALESMELRDDFPTYWRMITRCIAQGLQRKELIRSSLKSFINLSRYVLPDTFNKDLYNYLSNQDLRNLINADPGSNDSDS